MAYKGKKINNPFNKQTIEFITTSRDSNGAVLEMVSTWEAHTPKPAPHYHPMQEEYFIVREGEINIQLEDKTIVLRKNESLTIPAGTSHGMWNASGKPVTVSWRVLPALQTEYLLETGSGLATDRKVNRNGLPGILQSSLLLNKYRNEFRLTRPAYFLQRLLAYFFMPVAVLAGKKAVYKKYIN